MLLTSESKGSGFEMIIEKDVLVKMRDGTKLAVDIYRPKASGKFPALLAMSPYTKEAQSLVATLPHGLGFISEYSMVEAGDSEFFVDHGYVHVIADVRGAGKSEGEYFNIMSEQEGKDGYDLVEWIAVQPWSNGNVGMVGISYFGFVQYVVAEQQPPHLKAIFPFDGWGDTYRDISYHGGIPCVFPIIWLKGVQTKREVSVSKQLYSIEELSRRAEEYIDDEGTNYCRSPWIVGMLRSQDSFPIIYDYLINRVDGPFYWGRCPARNMDRIKIPTYLGAELHAYPVYMHLPGAANWGWERISGQKKLSLISDGHPGGPEDRPFHTFHDEIVKWYDYWLKGIDTGIMKEPPVQVFVRGAEKWRTGSEWPFLGRTSWRKFYLRADFSLKAEEPAGDESPDKLHYSPALPSVHFAAFLSPKPDYLVYKSEPLNADLEVVGPIALYLHASLSSDDGDFIISVKDVNPDGTWFNLTRGWLKASHREIDKSKSKVWRPYHPHTNPSPVEPGKVYEFPIEIQPIANLFKVGHRIQLEIWPCDFPVQPYDPTLGWGAGHHIAFGKEVNYEIHHSKMHTSHVLLPIIGES